jgi:hypothetical protein
VHCGRTPEHDGVLAARRMSCRGRAGSPVIEMAGLES